MKKLKTRVLSLFFAVCMLVNLAPINVFATTSEEQLSDSTEIMATVSNNDLEVVETETEDSLQLLNLDTVSDNTTSSGDTLADDGENADTSNESFDTFEELKIVCESNSITSGLISYDGTGALVIKSDLNIPANVQVDLKGKEIVVSEDAHLTINNGMYNLGKVTVEGTFEANTFLWALNGMVVNANGTLIVPNGFKAAKELTVSGNGSVQSPNSNVVLEYGTTITGIENISFEEDWQRVCFESIFTSSEELKLKLETLATNYINHDKVKYSLYVPYEETSTAVLEIKESITIPSHVVVDFDYRPFVLKEGVTITNNGEVNINNSFTINGALVNQGSISINRMNNQLGYAIKGSTGSYSGNGQLYAHTSNTEANISAFMSGFEFTNENFGNNVDGQWLHWYLLGENQGGNGPQTAENFATEAELVAIINKNDTTDRWVRYTGTIAFEIKNNLEIPSYLNLMMSGSELLVSSGATVTVESNIECKNLSVAGTMKATKRINVQDSIKVAGTLVADEGFNGGKSLDVSGKLELGGYESTLWYPAQISGLDKIQFRDEWLSIRVDIPYSTMSELSQKVSDVSVSGNYIIHSRVEYSLWFMRNQNTNISEFVITEDLTIPKHVNFFIQNVPSFVLDTGKTITVEGQLVVHEPFKVKGTIVNNGWMSVENVAQYDQRGVIVMENGAKIEGSSEIHVVGDASVAGPDAIIQGINMSDYNISSYKDPSGNTQWTVKNVAGLIKLATPKNPTWGTQYVEMWEYDKDKDMYVIKDYNAIPKAGFISWETDRPDQADARIRIYRVEPTGDVLVSEEYFGFGESVELKYRSTDCFLRSDLPSGKYYFTVQSMADYKEYRDSDIATSGYYEYTKPSEQMKGCTNLKWEDRDDSYVRWIKWDDKESQEVIDGYEVKFYFSTTENGSYEEYNYMWGRGNQIGEFPLGDWLLQDKGKGFYKFKVRALSGDIEKICNSPWSDLSPALNLVDVSSVTNNKLDSIINDANNSNTNMDAEDIRDAVQQMDTQDLKAALLTDTSNSETTDKLKQLEAKAGGPAPISVTQDATAFNASDISIVGANLNNKKDSTTDPIELVVDKPAKEHVIPELYNSSVAVKFSMTLSNVEDPKNLDVPVKITLPVPANINPQNLVVFHYHTDDTHEILRPHVYEKDGKYYADFVLTSFSDFIMTETVESNGGNTGSGSSVSKEEPKYEGPSREELISEAILKAMEETVKAEEAMPVTSFISKGAVSALPTEVKKIADTKSVYNISKITTTQGFISTVNKIVKTDAKAKAITFYSSKPFAFTAKSLTALTNAGKDFVYFFNYEGHLYKVTIPAGAKVDFGGAYFAGPLYIGAKLGTSVLVK